MTKPNTTTAAAPASMTYAEARAARINAQDNHAAALMAGTAAEAHEADLRHRLADGDATISASDLTSATGDVERRALLSEAAAAALKRARIAEAPLLAAHVADGLADVTDPEVMERAQGKAARAVSKALRDLADVADAQRRQVSQAIAEAKAAGLIGSNGRVSVGTQAMVPFLAVDGVRVIVTETDDAVGAALVAGAAGAGWLLSDPVLTAALVDVEPDEPEARDRATWEDFITQ